MYVLSYTFFLKFILFYMCGSAIWTPYGSGFITLLLTYEQVGMPAGGVSTLEFGLL